MDQAPRRFFTDLKRVEFKQLAKQRPNDRRNLSLHPAAATTDDDRSTDDHGADNANREQIRTVSAGLLGSPNPDADREYCLAERRATAVGSHMLLEKLPEVQSLPPEEKWRLIDELWRDLATQVEDAPADANVVELLEERFQAYLADPSQARPVDEVFGRLAEKKRQWK